MGTSSSVSFKVSPLVKPLDLYYAKMFQLDITIYVARNP